MQKFTNLLDAIAAAQAAGFTHFTDLTVSHDEVFTLDELASIWRHGGGPVAIQGTNEEVELEVGDAEAPLPEAYALTSRFILHDGEILYALLRPRELHLAIRHADEYHPLSVIGRTEGSAVPVPLHVFVRAEAPAEDGSDWLRPNHWQVLDDRGRALGFVEHAARPPLQIALKLAQSVLDNRESSFYVASIESEAARAGIYLSHLPIDTTSTPDARADALNAMFTEAGGGAAPYRLKPTWDAEAPALLAWLPAGFVVQGAQVVWLPAPMVEPFED